MAKSDKKAPMNLIFSVFIFILSVFYTYNAFKLSFGSVRSPGPGFLPRIVGIMASVLSAGLFISDYVKGKRDEADLDYPKKIIWFLICFVVYAIIFKPVGYVLSTVVFCFALAMIMENKFWTSVIMAVSTGIAFYLIFTLLSVPLPKGLLG